jgi:hypothetical protein
MINTTAGPADSNLVPAFPVLFKMNRFAKKILSTGIGGLALGLLVLPAPAAQPVALPANLPLYFEASQGQANVPAQFIARGLNYQFLIAPTEAQIVLRQTTAESAVVRMQFVGANAQAPVSGDAELPGKINHLTGNDPAQWRVGLAMFAKVRVGGLYPGVNLVYYGNQQQLEYDFDIAPGANPRVIAMHFDGVDKISINPQGELILSLAGGKIRQPKPVIYQTVDGVRKEIAGGYQLVDTHTVAFAVGQYDHSQPLIIDPVLSYSTYFGGSAGDTAYAVALDASGNVYITGQTFSKEFSTTNAFSTPGAYQTNFAGGKLTGDAFVFKLYASNGVPAYITYLGGSDDEVATCLAVDNNGNAFIAGYTDSTDFPVSTNVIQKTIGGAFRPSYGSYPVDAFVAELDPSGGILIYSTYLGGSGVDGAYGIAVDAADNAYITGFTSSTNFSVTNAIAYHLAGGTNTVLDHLACTNSIYFNVNAFVAKIASNGTSLVYSSYFGGNNFDEGRGIAVDTNTGCVYVTGFTASTNFPTANAVVQELVWANVVGTNQTSITNSLNGYLLNSCLTNKTSRFDAFVAKFDSTGTNLLYSTYLGGANNDVANGIAVDTNGAAYVTGWTVSTNFPNTLGTSIPGLHSFVATNTSLGFPATNVFLTKIITNGTSQAVIAWSAVFGGKGADIGYGVAVDPAGEVFVTGSASSTNFPTFNIPTLMRYTNSGKSDAFVIAFNTNATALLYSAYLGGKDNDYGYGIAVSPNGDAYVVGQTLSTNFLTLSTNSLALVADYPSRNGTNDAFLAKITLSVTAPTTATILPTNQAVAVGSSATFSVSVDTNGTPPFFYQWQNFVTNLVTVTNVVDGTNQVTTTNVVAWMNLVDGGNISGAATNSSATNDTLIISNAQITNSGNYQVIITNYGGSVTSSNAVLTVTNVPPEIGTQPASQTNGVGTTVKFAVIATGTPPFGYQWWVNGTNLVENETIKNGPTISGATSNVLTIKNVQLTNGGSYTVIVTNIAGSATSSNAVLTVLSSPVIEVQPIPTNQVMAVGATAAFFVNAIGTVPLHYQWWLNGTNLVKNGSHKNGPIFSGATTTNLTIKNVQMTNSGSYTVVVTNIAGSVISSNALLTVTNVPPAITRQPLSQTNGVGTTVTFAVTATGTAPLSYQWQVGGINLVNGAVKNGPTISGATTNVLTIKNVQLTNSGSYTVIVTNYGGSVTSSNAVLTVLSSPVIVSLQPTNQAMAVGSNASFTVTAIGTVPLHYQWWVNGTNLVKNGSHKNGPIFSGATTTNLTIKNVQMTNSGSYTVVVTNLAGSVTSSNAVLTVTNIPPAITRQPLSQTNGVGTEVTFTVTATGTAPLSYQWWDGTNLVKNGVRISGATSNVLIISNVQLTNGGIYTVVVTNTIYGGSATTNASLTVLSSPVIVLQPTPTNQVMAAGATATFTVNAIGTVPLSYQWWVDGTKLVNGTNLVNRVRVITSGATTTNLTISNAQMNNSGNYSVVVTNIAGSVTSSVFATLTVTNSLPSITGPTNQTVVVGANVKIAVTATGTVPLSYQWQMNGTNLVNSGHSGQIGGATTDMLTIGNAQTNNSGSYSVIVTNLEGSVTSSVAILTVASSPVITTQPTNQTVAVGATVTNAVIAVGIGPLRYQWWVDGTNLVKNGDGISGATNSVLTIINAQTTNSGSYKVTITNLAGSVTSSNAVLTVASPPAITMQPTNQTAGVGATTVTFAVTATGTEPLSYQWQDGTNILVDGGQINGAISNVLTISNVQLTNNGNYTVTITNLAGSVTSSNALLTVTNMTVTDIPPAITAQPTNQTVGVGATTVTFAVTATGTEPLSYQWQDGTNILVDGGQINGAISNVLTISNVQLTNNGNYTVTITNLAGSVTSSNAVLTVILPPSFGNIIATNGGSFILSGTGGVSNGNYYVLASSNLLAPLTNWTPIATNQFDSEGDFIFTNTAQTNAPQLFYLLQLP